MDTDPQGDLTKSLGWKDPDSLETTIANHLGVVIEGEEADPREGVLAHKEGVDLMPANIELAGMEMPALMAMSREQLMNVWVSPLKADGSPSSRSSRESRPPTWRPSCRRSPSTLKTPSSVPERGNPYLEKPHLGNRRL